MLKKHLKELPQKDLDSCIAYCFHVREKLSIATYSYDIYLCIEIVSFCYSKGVSETCLDIIRQDIDKILTKNNTNCFNIVVKRKNEYAKINFGRENTKLTNEFRLKFIINLLRQFKAERNFRESNN